MSKGISSETSDQTLELPVAVIGDGWSALASVASLVSLGIRVKWIVGSGSRVAFPLSTLEWGPGVEVWQKLTAQLGLTARESQVGTWIREFRNKAFREPFWVKAPTPEARLEVRDETLWSPERWIVGAFDARLDETLPAEQEEEMRKVLLSGQFPQLERIEELRLTGFSVKEGRAVAVKLESGEEVACQQVIYADRWGLLPAMEGLPKGLGFLRKREPVGVLQASFSHDFGNSSGLPGQSYFSSLFRGSAEEAERHVWGYFSTDSKRSFWTLCLGQEEIESNQAIGKKLRRLKGTLDRMFQGSDLIPEGKPDFCSTITQEQVRFEEEAYFSGGSVPEKPLTLAGISNLVFLTDGYGPTRAFELVQKHAESLLGGDGNSASRAAPQEGLGVEGSNLSCAQGL